MTGMQPKHSPILTIINKYIRQAEAIEQIFSFFYIFIKISVEAFNNDKVESNCKDYQYQVGFAKNQPASAEWQSVTDTES